MKHGGQRIATMLMYLSDNVEGGETYFPAVMTYLEYYAEVYISRGVKLNLNSRGALTQIFHYYFHFREAMLSIPMIGEASYSYKLCFSVTCLAWSQTLAVKRFLRFWIFSLFLSQYKVDLIS